MNEFCKFSVFCSIASSVCGGTGVGSASAGVTLEMERQTADKFSS